MYSWPTHFPSACPPPSAEELTGTVFRFINGATPVEKDFKSHYERNPGSDWGHQACMARGLSVLRTLADCAAMKEAIPALRKKRIAVAEIESSIGVIAPTPSNSCDGHCTWWRSVAPSAVVPLFSTVP